MGSETTTTMNNKSTGKIILDPVTGIIREKTINYRIKWQYENLLLVPCP